MQEAKQEEEIAVEKANQNSSPEESGRMLKDLENKISESVVNKLEKNADINVLKGVQNCIKDPSFEDSFKEASMFRHEDKQKLLEYASKDVESLQQEEINDMKYRFEALSNSQKLFNDKYKQSTKNENINIEEFSQPYIGGANTPVNKNIDSVAEDYPESQYHIDAVSRNGQRAYNYKNWKNALHEDQRGSYRDALAYRTWSEDKKELAEDIANIDNPLATLKSISRKTADYLAGRDTNLYSNPLQEAIDEYKAREEFKEKYSKAMSGEQAVSHILL